MKQSWNKAPESKSTNIFKVTSSSDKHVTNKSKTAALATSNAFRDTH